MCATGKKIVISGTVKLFDAQERGIHHLNGALIFLEFFIQTFYSKNDV